MEIQFDISISEFLSTIGKFTDHEDCLFYFSKQGMLVPINSIYKDEDNNVIICYDNNIIINKDSLRLKDVIKKLIYLSIDDEDCLMYYKDLSFKVDMRSSLAIYKKCYYDKEKNIIVYNIPLPDEW